MVSPLKEQADAERSKWKAPGRPLWLEKWFSDD